MGENGGTTPRILNFGIKRMSVSRPGRIIAKGKGPPALIAHETGWAAERAWILGREEATIDLLCVPSAQRDWVKS